MKKVIYIRSSNIYDDSRATKEITALLENGYMVCVLGWNRDGKAYDSSMEVFENYCNSIKLYFFNYSASMGVGTKNINVMLKWIFWIKKKLKEIDNIDAIHACDLNCALGYYHYCKKNNIKIIYDIFDYYVDAHSIPSFLRYFIERLEISVINKSNVTIICTEERRKQIVKSNPKKVIIIHNSPEVSLNNNTNSIYDYVYCGTLGDKRLISEILLDYENNSDLKFAIAGYGKYSKIAEELDKKYTNFSFLGPLKYDEVLELESKSLTISAIYEPTIRNHKLCAPNKFYEALALAKPVIVCEGTGIDKIVNSDKIGSVIKYNCKEFYSELRKLKNNKKMCLEMGEKGRKLYEERYKWSIMKNRLLEMYDEVLK